MRTAREMTLFLAVVMAVEALRVASERGVSTAISHGCKNLPLIVLTNKYCSVNTPAEQHPRGTPDLLRLLMKIYVLCKAAVEEMQTRRDCEKWVQISTSFSSCAPRSSAALPPAAPSSGLDRVTCKIKQEASPDTQQDSVLRSFRE